ncbi:hypothetical protein GLOIN_2v1764892 [Rhizophagus irregularis DAOM 181602=DAOM 197198]|uniref:Uncharacterized protein n=1 Tax=Rhizophagus irregularis (strain DAOM 181602 / DAOM 197198 / MUCL 43194) TaxID=747089 RepID=A0A2P4QRA5_RHIID|nr:hypothetical protein GLOIN_2v1764892 [Rhizophagus irregularis DAOM 181602=DAOM 197198]POG80108.1 hypothetical protein GLOIN_2v1764892 [Rhizophagus irregularis DAOM 181602=DAOM 197198]GET54604.1 hypothetical protein GLOIN_2v1764892 [Rhizophagus irregularis DAOM 181602=DAOM 197198]|eukprot:XP_025186974.1 hypothetical protein GLOIN_2v1764892 [Rhizophagus irregularis DAOM 181602=DAOM 197198]
MASKDYQVDYYINSLIIDRLIEVNIAGKILMDMIVKGQESDETSGDLSLYVTIYIEMMISACLARNDNKIAQEFANTKYKSYISIL